MANILYFGKHSEVVALGIKNTETGEEYRFTDKAREQAKKLSLKINKVSEIDDIMLNMESYYNRKFSKENFIYNAGRLYKIAVSGNCKYDTLIKIRKFYLGLYEKYNCEEYSLDLWDDIYYTFIGKLIELEIKYART